MKKNLFTVAFFGVVTASAQAALIIDNFDSYTAGSNLHGQSAPSLPNGNTSSAWTVTNGGIAQGGFFHAEAAPGSWDASSGSAYFGGWDPVTPGIVSMSANASITLADFTSTSIEIASFQPTGPGPNPTYSVTIGSTAGNLVTISLAPVAGGFNITASGLYASPTGTIFIGEGTPTPLQLTTAPSGTDVSFSLTNGVNTLASGTFSGSVTTGASLTGLEISYDATGGSGDGYLQIDNVTMIPEPSTALLGLVSAAFFFTRRRR